MIQPGRIRLITVVGLSSAALGCGWFLEHRFGWPPAVAWATSAALWVGGLILPSALGLTAPARERRRLHGLTLFELDRLSGDQFERWVAHALRIAGFDVERTTRSRDYGVDLIASARGQRIAIEVKRRGQRIGNRVVRSVVAGAEFHGCDVAAIVTQATFTGPARRQAAHAKIDVLLFGRDALPHLGQRLWAACP